MTQHGLKRGACAIAGVAESDLGEVAAGLSPLDLMGQAAQRALADAGLSLRDVDGLFATTSQSRMPTLALAEYLGIRPRYHDGTNIGGCSFMSMVAHAQAAIQAGLCEVALIAYASGLPFPAVYFAVSVPFLVFGWRRMGAAFALKTLGSVAALSVMTAVLPRWISFDHIEPAFAAILFGGLFGIAALAVVRHGGSFGGVSILWLMLQDRTGFRAGYAQLIFDAALFALSAFFIAPATLGWSFLGALVFNLFLAVNHRKDRYIAT